MISRPLDLASRLRPPPQGMGALHYVNVILLVIFFVLFGSRFVLSPGLGVDFEMPRLEGARAGAAQTPFYINVLRSGQIFTDDGLVDQLQLHDWLKARAASEAHPTLLIRASADVKLSELVEIRSAARDAGFGNVLIGAEDRAAGLPAAEAK
jgi:biopolymer transport protein ExbD